MTAVITFAILNRWLGVVLALSASVYFLYLYPDMKSALYSIYRTGVSLLMVGVFGLLLSGCRIPAGIADYIYTLYSATIMLEFASVLYLTLVSTSAALSSTEVLRSIIIRFIRVLAGALLVIAIAPFLITCVP